MKKTLFSLAAFIVGMTMVQPASALEVDADGVYQIGTAQDLMDFAVLVNDKAGGVENNAASAVLTTDIDLADVFWTPIGNGDRKYCGTFDGQFHRIKNLKINADVKEQGFFGVVANATIKNLIIDASCEINGTMCASAFAGSCNGSGVLTFENCGNEANVHGTSANNSAFVGCNYSSGALKVVFNNCYNTGNISGGWENGVFCGWFAYAGEVNNCYNTGRITEAQEDNSLGRGMGDGNYHNSYDLNEANNRKEAFILADFTQDWFATGTLCYALNGDQSNIGWYQNIGEDAVPTFDPAHKQVYAIGEVHCNGDLKGDISGYSNNAADTKRDEHNFVDGVCDYCGLVDETYATAVDGVYEISNAKQLVWFSAMAAVHPDVCAKLMNDIDMTGVSNWQPIGPDVADKYYCGTFDGQLHRIKNLKVESTEQYRAVFGVVAGATIKNLIIDSSCFFTGGKYAAAFVSAAKGEGTLTIENCGNEAEILGTDQNNSAFLGCNFSSGNVKVIMKYCYNTGKISGGFENGIFSGWFASAGTVTGCWNIGELSEGGDNSLGRGINANGFINSYELNENNLAPESSFMPGFSKNWIASGRVAYTLNGDQSEIGWYQNIGEDAYPTLDPTHKQVYVNSELYCDGNPKNLDAEYTNTVVDYVMDEHNYVDGVCDRCGKDQEGFIERNKVGYYLIETPAQFQWFGAKASVEPTVKAKIMADLDMSGIDWEPIAKFGGVIDGQMHKISNLVIEKTENYVGLIALGMDGATIKNLIMDETCSVTGASYVAAFIGSSDGNGTITFENVGNEANIIGTGSNVAGFVGVSMGSSMFFQMDNCYNTGDIIGGCESAALTGWAGNASAFNNCYNTGVVVGADGSKTLYRGTSTLTNCYNIDGNQATGFTEDQLYSGELAFLLNGSVSGGEAWFQNLDSDDNPVPFSTHAKVYQVGTKLCDGTIGDEVAYSNEEGVIEIPDHEFGDCVCDICGYPVEGYLTPNEEGIFEIASGEDLVWFAGYVSFIDGTASAKLVDDIDLGGIDWHPIGKPEHPFTGKFLGQDHFIDNLDYEGGDIAGLFGAISGGAELSNFILSSTCIISGNAYVSGIVADAVGEGTARITNVGNEAQVNAVAQNAAGIVGVCMGGTCSLVITNCYNTGDITGDRESAAICGWTGGTSTIQNCYNAGFVIGVDGTNYLYRNPGTQGVNNYNLNEAGQGTVFTEEELANGKLAFMLNGSVNGGGRYYQNLCEDRHPIPFSDHGKIYQVKDMAGYYTNADDGTQMEYTYNFEIPYFGYCTIIVPFDVNIPEGMVVYSSPKLDDAVLDLVEESSIEANTPYLIEGKPGKYSFTGKVGSIVEQQSSSIFTGVNYDTKITEGYVLQDGTNGVAFYKVDVKNPIIIPAGRCYIKSTAASAPSLLLRDVTSITQKTIDEGGERYDLQGRPIINGLVHGLVIENAKKKFVK